MYTQQHTYTHTHNLPPTLTHTHYHTHSFTLTSIFLDFLRHSSHAAHPIINENNSIFPKKKKNNIIEFEILKQFKMKVAYSRVKLCEVEKSGETHYVTSIT